MKCVEVLSLLSPYQDGELDRKKSISIKLHLKDCESCRREFDRLELVEGMISGLIEIEPPNSFNALIMDKIKNRENRAGKFVRAFSYSFIFFFFFIMGVYFYFLSANVNMEKSRVLSVNEEIMKSQHLSVLDMNLSKFLAGGERKNEERVN